MKLKFLLLCLMSILTLSMASAQNVGIFPDVPRRVLLTKLGFTTSPGHIIPRSLDNNDELFDVVQYNEEIEITAMNDCGAVVIEITSLTGTIYAVSTNMTDGTVIEIPIDDFTHGVYTIYIYVENSTYVGTFIL